MNLLSEAPSKFTVSTKVAGEWKVIGGLDKVTSRYVDIIFPEPLKSDAVRINIADQSGDGLVALRSVMLLRAAPQYAPMRNECNNSVASYHYNISSAFDNDPGTSMKIKCDGWLLIPMHDAVELNVITQGNDVGIPAEQTDGFNNWESIDVVSGEHKAKITPSRKFARIHFPKTIEPSVNSLDRQRASLIGAYRPRYELQETREVEGLQDFARLTVRQSRPRSL